jgi:RNA polymerase-binding transcription factor DksA
MPIPYDQFKLMLLSERVSLTAQLEKLKAVAITEAVGYHTHPADDGSAAFDQARDLSIEVNEEHTLQLVEDALKRFENGTYGVCVVCGREIGAPRLEAIPYTPYCLDDALKLEHH